ncbi:MAG: hypothetical protein WDZ91_07295 [Paenibacillaceae bacterium]
MKSKKEHSTNFPNRFARYARSSRYARTILELIERNSLVIINEEFQIAKKYNETEEGKALLQS